MSPTDGFLLLPGRLGDAASPCCCTSAGAPSSWLRCSSSYLCSSFYEPSLTSGPSYLHKGRGNGVRGRITRQTTLQQGSLSFLVVLSLPGSPRCAACLCMPRSWNNVSNSLLPRFLLSLPTLPLSAAESLPECLCSMGSVTATLSYSILHPRIF